MLLRCAVCHQNDVVERTPSGLRCPHCEARSYDEGRNWVHHAGVTRVIRTVEEE